MNLNVRMPADLHERLKQRASKDMRSLNYEVLWLLALALDTLDSSDPREREQADAS